VQGTDDHVASHPEDKKPPSPVETVEQERSANNREKPGDPDETNFISTLCFEIGKAPGGGCIDKRHQAHDNCDAAEGDK